MCCGGTHGAMHPHVACMNLVGLIPLHYVKIPLQGLKPLEGVRYHHTPPRGPKHMAYHMKAYGRVKQPRMP